MKKLLPFLISLFVGVILFFLVIRFVGWGEIKKAFLTFKTFRGIIILGLIFLMILIGVFEWKVILKGLGIDFSFKELFQSFLAGFSIMYLFPPIFFGREIFRGYFLKKKKGIPFSKAMTSTLIDRVLDFTTEFVFIFSGILFFLFFIGIPPKRFLIIFGGIFLFSLVSLSFFYFKILKRESFLRFLIKPISQRTNSPLEVEKPLFEFFKLKNKYMWQGYVLTFFEKVVEFLKTWLLISFLGEFPGFFPTLSILSFYYLAAMIPIPAQLGSQEAIQAFLFSRFNLGMARGVAFSILDKGAQLIFVFLGVLLLFKIGTEFLKERFSK